MRFAELLHLPRRQRHQPVDRKIELWAADDGLPIRSDLQDHELLAASGADAAEPMRLAEIEQLSAGRGDVLQDRHGVDVARRGERKQRI